MNYLKRYLIGFAFSTLLSWGGAFAAMLLICFLSWSADGFSAVSWGYFRLMVVWSALMAFFLMPKK
ncbi:hypothetical protein Hena1_00650 [Erwinia phage Hena1]|uniref:Uncharacterized protein n=1 Tax=Erwinia phage Hena1 TaxID=2678601 RepID=A0A6B9J5P2_9CAUD|nr:hypothetical protein HWC84_gp064 [Erwinia phage Hena1]QGZ16241.1 hypothetical protein Hena1_00650 [Erwinia phage Hena1]